MVKAGLRSAGAASSQGGVASPVNLPPMRSLVVPGAGRGGSANAGVHYGLPDRTGYS